MTALRQLSVVYVAAAGAYAIAMAMSAHPSWVKEADQTARYVRTHTAATAIAFDEHVLRPDMKMAEAAGRALERSIAGAFHSDTVKVAHRDLPVKVARVLPAKHRASVQTAAPSSPAPTDLAPPQSAPSPDDDTMPAPLRGNDSTATATADENASATPAPHVMKLLPQTVTPPANATASLPPQGAPSAAEIIRVEERLKASLTSEMADNFSLFLYVSKAQSGPWAQRMYVFQKQRTAISIFSTIGRCRPGASRSNSIRKAIDSRPRRRPVITNSIRIVPTSITPRRNGARRCPMRCSSTG